MIYIFIMIIIDDVYDAIDEWRRRLWACVQVKGQQFEHLL